jgi:hypothetical protein
VLAWELRGCLYVLGAQKGVGQMHRVSCLQPWEVLLVELMPNL